MCFGQFPSWKNLEFPLNDKAASFFEHGSPFRSGFCLFIWLFFWDRTKILLLLLPMLLILLIGGEFLRIAGQLGSGSGSV